MDVNGTLEPSSLVELTLNRLRHESLSGALAPGERLVEEHLPRRGARVADLSATDCDELFALRSASSTVSSGTTWRQTRLVVAAP
jgi:DNA-binding GntR family transcriptional regulator